MRIFVAFYLKYIRLVEKYQGLLGKGLWEWMIFN
ncbi:MAG: hypothetical protein BTN85_1180 [Candidatus Methanohalarchaeum thermophilum]|uniref:Uncharacterized protein n=1 Tax=Methanohalarchaeum thermophilum TaxID=1903181 RepID=A0A1Q6DWG4_METT1|nr:MAG: hypothetical protein BTN85_1180 [Candidatus Methanohalarchaeum thermophilum]